MPIHDWTRVSSGTFHDFHQGWTIEIRNVEQRGSPGRLLRNGRPMGKRTRTRRHCASVTQPGTRGRGLVVAETPPRIKRAARVDTEFALYPRKANRIVIHHELGRVVAMIEIVSPGNKDNKHAVASFIAKAVGLHPHRDSFSDDRLVPFWTSRPARYSPGDLGRTGWRVAGSRPADKPLTVAAFDAGDELTA